MFYLKTLSLFLKQTDSLCSHIDSYLKAQQVPLQYLNSSKVNKDQLARTLWEKLPSKTGLIAAFSTVELCNTITVAPNHESKLLEVASRSTKCKHLLLFQ